MSGYWAMPDYVENWIDVAFRQLPKGWDLISYPTRGLIQVTDDLKRVRNTYSYQAIHDGVQLPKEWDDE